MKNPIVGEIAERTGNVLLGEKSKMSSDIFRAVTYKQERSSSVWLQKVEHALLGGRKLQGKSF